MAKEEKIYQFGNLVFQQKHELKMSLSREVKDFETDGVYDGVADDFGFGRHNIKQYKIGIDHDYQDDPTALNKLDWDLYNHHLLNSGKQKAFFSTIDDNYKVGEPIMKYNYAHIARYDPTYRERMKKLKYDIKLDSPFFFDCTNDVKYLADSAVATTGPTWNDSQTWNNGISTWSNPPPYQSLTGMTPLQLVNLFGQKVENGAGMLYLEDQYFFEKNFVAPTFNSSFDYSKLINTSDFFLAGDKYQASISLNNLQLNGSCDNLCYIMQMNKEFPPGAWIEIINEKNLTGLRLQNLTTQTIYGLNYYNFMNQELYDIYGQKLNTNGKLEVTKIIPDQALDYLYFDTTIKDKTQYYPSMRIYASNNTPLTIKIKNQRIYS
jgi:hypothetical protein